MTDNITLPRVVVEFLLGEGPLDGVWYGDEHPTNPRPYWWRKHIRAALAEPDAKPEPVAYLYHDAQTAQDAHPLMHSTMLVLATDRRPEYRNETPLYAAPPEPERERAAELTRAYQEGYEHGSRNARQEPPAKPEPDAIARAVGAEKHRAEVAISTLDAWFNLSMKAESEGASVLNDALETYLRRSINGGMPEKHAKIVRKVVNDAARIYFWNALVPVIRGIAAAVTPEPATDEQAAAAYDGKRGTRQWVDFRDGWLHAERFHGITKEDKT